MPLVRINGKNARFPDSMSKEDIEKVLSGMQPEEKPEEITPEEKPVEKVPVEVLHEVKPEKTFKESLAPEKPAEFVFAETLNQATKANKETNDRLAGVLESLTEAMSDDWEEIEFIRDYEGDVPLITGARKVR